MKKKLKSALSLLLCMIMVFSTVPFATAAQENAGSDSELAYSSADGMGKIVNNLSSESEAKKSEDYCILETKVSGGKATVTYSAVADCKVIVAAFDEDSGRMIGSGNADVTAAESEATVTMDCTLPSEYVLKSYLVSSDLSPLSTEHIDLQYTSAYQEFLEKTPEDYKGDEVVIFDEKQSDFGVLDDDVVAGESSAAMTYTYDEATLTYVFKNATDEVKALKVGDIFYYEYGENTNEFLLFKVKGISVSGSTVTIIEDEDISLEEAFKFIRIDEEADFSQVSVDENELGESLTHASQPQNAPTKAPVRVIDNNEKSAFSDTYTLSYKNGKHVSITGSLGVQLSVEARLYYDVVLFGKDYCEFKTEINMKWEFKVSVTGKIGIDKSKVRIPIPDIPMGPFFLKISIYPVAEFSGSAEFSASLSLKYTVSYDSHTDELKKGQWSDLTPKAEIKEKIEIKIGGGIEFDLSLLKILGVAVSGEGGVKATLALNTGLGLWLDKHHSCAACFDGAVNFFVELKLSIKIKIIPKVLEFNRDALKWSYEKYLFDFYVSVSGNGIKCGKGECPNIEYSVEFTVLDKAGKALEGATVTASTGRCDAHGDGKYDDTSAKTDKNGKVVFYFKKGNHTFTVSKDGETKSESFKIVAVPKTITVKFGDSGMGGGTDLDPNPTPGIIDKLSYEIGNGWVIITDCDTSLSGDIVLPSRIVGNPVVGIVNYAFSDCSSLTSITIPNSVTSIGDYAFYDCINLTSATIPDSVTSIGNYVFWGCSSLTGMVIPESVTSIGYNAFSFCSSLTSITIPDSVIEIGDEAFLGCSSLTRVTIPDNVTSIGYGAFQRCSSLTSIKIPSSVIKIDYNSFGNCTSLTAINVDPKNTEYSSVAGVLFNKDKSELLAYPAGKGTSYLIPSTVTNIGVLAFSGCSSLTSITIPDSVTSIGCDAFYGCKGLTSITIPNSVTSIGIDAFSGCSSLTSIIIPIGVTNIDNYAFYGCKGLTSIAIPDSVTSIGSCAFYACSSLTSIAIPDSVTSIYGSAFEDCSSLKDVYYSGTQEQWKKISIESSNDYLTSATIHYGSSAPAANARAMRAPAAPAAQSTVYTATAQNTVPGELYMLYAFSSDTDLSSLEYVAQLRAESSEVKFRYIPRNLGDLNVVIVGKFGDGSVQEPVEPEYGVERLELISAPAKVEYDYLSSPAVDLDGLRLKAIYSDGTEKEVTAAQGVTASELDTSKLGEQSVQLTYEGASLNITVTVVPRKFRLVWTVDGNETELTVAEGSKITKPADPELEGYDFMGWSPEVPETMPAHDMTFTAVFEVRKYNANLVVDGKLYQTIEYTHGQQSVDLPPVPEKEGYTGKWEDYTLTAGGVTINAVYTVNSYTVKWIVNGKETAESYDFGSKITKPADPELEGYDFMGWSPEVPETMPAHDMTFTAVFEVRKYNANLVVDGKLYQTIEYTHGQQSVDLPPVPEKEGYTGKWEDYTLTAGGVTINAVYTVNSYTVKWIVNGKETAESYDFGSKITKPADPELEGYDFMGWSPEVPETMPAHDLTFTAVFEPIKTKLSINTPSTTTVSYGFTLNLHANVTDLPEGARVAWSMDGSGFELIPSADGMTCGVKSVSKGSATITAKVVDKNGNAVKDANGNEITASQKLTSKAGFFQKLVAFFKKLFGSNMVIPSSLNKLVK